MQKVQKTIDKPVRLWYNSIKQMKGETKMKTFTFNYLNNYKNHGQNAEQSVRFTLTGEICKADNVPHHMGSDVLNFQVKSARATVCKGTDIQAYLDMDASEAYIYADKQGTAYIMNRVEYTTFITLFGTQTRESTRNGGGAKIRLKDETKAMMAWLRENS